MTDWEVKPGVRIIACLYVAKLSLDEAVLNAHAMKDEEDPEEERLEQLKIQRDTLLQTRRQRRPPVD